VGRRFRTERARLEALLDGEQDPSPSVVTGLEALRRRSAQLVPVTAELRRLIRGQQLSTPMTDLAASYAHMHVNRLLRSAHRAQELVLYELLDRAYSARAGRRAGVS
jgi:thiopeptide-type bacteriocin biosynthesis protein